MKDTNRIVLQRGHNRTKEKIEITLDLRSHSVNVSISESGQNSDAIYINGQMYSDFEESQVSDSANKLKSIESIDDELFEQADISSKVGLMNQVDLLKPVSSKAPSSSESQSDTETCVSESVFYSTRSSPKQPPSQPSEAYSLVTCKEDSVETLPSFLDHLKLFKYQRSSDLDNQVFEPVKDKLENYPIMFVGETPHKTSQQPNGSRPGSASSTENLNSATSSNTLTAFASNLKIQDDSLPKYDNSLKSQSLYSNAAEESTQLGGMSYLVATCRICHQNALYFFCRRCGKHHILKSVGHEYTLHSGGAVMIIFDAKLDHKHKYKRAGYKSSEERLIKDISVEESQVPRTVTRPSSRGLIPFNTTEDVQINHIESTDSASLESKSKASLASTRSTFHNKISSMTSSLRMLMNRQRDDHKLEASETNTKQIPPVRLLYGSKRNPLGDILINT